jgi:threonine dehydrogenase-like Zn-dependent dehydrogenase
MRALVYEGSHLAFEGNYPHPARVQGEALISVLLAGICNTDLEILRGYMGFRGVLGHEFVGVIEEVYSEREQDRALVGKRVVGEINAACHLPNCSYCQQGMHSHCPNRTTLGIDRRDGVFADYTTLPISNLYVVPDNVSDEEAIFTEPLAANFEMLEQVHFKPTHRVIVLGDGKMGQLAARVLALTSCDLKMVGKHADKLALATQSGIATYQLKEADSTGTPGLTSITGGERVDVVVECTGSAQGLALAMALVRPRGTILLKSTVASKSTLNLAPLVIDEIRVQGSRCGPFAPALHALSNKQVDASPLINARYSLDDGLAAFEYAEQKGVLKVLVQVS